MAIVVGIAIKHQCYKKKTMKIFISIILWIVVARVFMWVGERIFKDKNKFYE